MVQQSIDFVGSQIKEHTRLGADGRFITTSEYPEFVWKEIIINAIAHRDYSIKGTDIQIKMFDDHITVESPGTLPGIVRFSNFRTVHFSRNPKIAHFMQEYDFVREFGEGIDRMFKEMAEAGLPAPEYTDNAFMLNATIRNGDNIMDNVRNDGSVNGKVNGNDGSVNGKVDFAGLNKNELLVYKAIATNLAVTRSNLIDTLSISARTIDRVIKSLKDKGVIERVGSDKTGHWRVKDR